MGKKLKAVKKRANKHKKNFSKMSKKKKILIGAGVAAVAVTAVAGSLFVGKVIYDKRKNQKNAPGLHREVVDDGPESPALAPFKVANPKTNMDTIPIPDAVALGLSYDEESGAKLNLLAAVYDSLGNNLGFIQAGGSLTSLFNGAITHTGDSQAETLGDQENIIIDFRGLPAQATTVMFGTYVVNPATNGSSKPYVQMLPMLRNETIQAQEAAGGTRSIDFDSDEEDEQFLESGTRGIGDEEEEEESFVRLFMDELDNHQSLPQQGFVAGKIFRNHLGTWSFTPFRTVVNADAQFGLWPALEHYAKPVQAQYQQSPQQSPQFQHSPQQAYYGQPQGY